MEQDRQGDMEQIADDEQRNISQICELLLHEGVWLAQKTKRPRIRPFPHVSKAKESALA